MNTVKSSQFKRIGRYMPAVDALRTRSAGFEMDRGLILEDSRLP